MTQNHISVNLTSYFKVFEESLTKPQFSHFKSWVQGIIHGKTHGSDIAKHFSSKHETSLTRFHSRSKWEQEEINQIRINHAINVASQAMIEEQSAEDLIANINHSEVDDSWCYIIDDTTNEKYGKQVPGGGYHWSNSAKRSVWGQKLVTSHLRIGNSDFPLFTNLYDKNSGVSKIEIAMQHIESFELPQDEKQGVLLVDSWFSSKDIIRKAMERELNIITMIKRNRLIKPHGLDDQWIPVNKISGSLRKSGLRRVKVENTKFRYAQITGTIKNFNDEAFKILLVQQYLPSKRKWSKFKYLLSGDATMEAWTILRFYKKRWSIETFYKFAKERLGFAKSRVMTEYSLSRFILLLFCAYTYLSLAKNEMSTYHEGGGSYYHVQDQVIGNCQTQLINWVYIQTREGRSLKEILLIMGLVKKSA